MSAIDKEKFPKAALIGAALLVGLSITMAAIGRQAQLAAPAVTEQPGLIAERSLIFADGSDGSVVVRDAEDGALVQIVQRGEGGFVRGVMRGLARDRRSRGIGQDPAFRLSEWQSGRLALEDPMTGKVIDLNAFGRDNRRAFSEILYARGDL
jgi:putative photosynthetic complex assembly protein